MKASLLASLVVLAACATDEPAPSPSEATLEIARIFETRVRGDGTPLADARVSRVDANGIIWAPEGAAERRLVWADVQDVESQQDQEKPAHPETLYLYLTRGSHSVDTAAPEKPPLSGSEVVRTYVMLRDRPAGSRVRLVRALHVVARAAKPRPAPDVAPPTSSSTTEERLGRLKELHDKGLITDDVYRDEQRKILSSGY